ncbi:MAG TPA: cysteine desulfurase family protein, partial [Bdellovibrionales bacterium]|nr:cysteine desulfurase family protein [Bdellovibrionales bacterium]
MKTQKPLYFDNQATTPLDPAVFESMVPYFLEKFGNPVSVQHAYGWEASLAVETARKQVARLIGAEPTEIVFTSGATESISLAVAGYLKKQPARSHVITCATEHKATLEAMKYAQDLGHEVTILPVDKLGQITVAQVEAALKPNTVLMSLMHANNEIGTIHPITEIGALLRSKNIAFHVDAAQTAGKHPIDVRSMNIDLLSISSHKFHGPKGIGALFIGQKPNRIQVAAQAGGGGQERGIRGGTLNVPAIVGLGKAAEIAIETMDSASKRIAGFCEKIRKSLPEADLNGHPSNRLCGNLSLSFSKIDTDEFLQNLNGIAFSMASACSGSGKSHVLTAIDRNQDDAVTLRIGMGRFTTQE